MPNWKTYESSVRLLSAIVAAHPELKLKYDEMAARFGGDCTKSSLENRFRRIKTDAQLMNEAFNKGIDPISLDIGGPDGAAPLKGGFGRDVARYYGCQLNGVALRGHFQRTINTNVKALQAAIDGGQDPTNVVMVDGVQRGSTGKDIAECFGGGLKGHALSVQMARHIRPISKLIREALARGEDPLETVSVGAEGRSKSDIATCFGDGLKGGALSKQFSLWVKPTAKLIQEALARGEDPFQTVPVGTEVKTKETAKYYKIGATANSVQLQWTRKVKHQIQALRDCVERGDNPANLEILSDVKVVGKGNDLRECFGTDVTETALKNQFWGPIKKNVAAINTARAAVVDCKDIELPSLKSGASSKKIQAFFGSDATAGGIRFQISTTFKDNVTALKDARSRGLDCLKVELPSLGGASAKDISKYFGSDSSSGGIGFQFRSIKAYAKLARDCVQSGGDPKTLNIGGDIKSALLMVQPLTRSLEIAKYVPDCSGCSLQHRFRSVLRDAKAMRKAGGLIARLLNDGTTSIALEHRFRPIKKNGEVMKAAIASNYGEGASGKAVSTYLERVKKDPQWNLANTIAENGNGVGGGGSSAKKGTPKGKKPAGTPRGKKAMQGSEDSEDLDTPTKKGLLNKVASGRVQKPSRNSAKKANYREASDDEEDNEEISVVKAEPEGFMDIEPDSQNSRSSGMNGHSNGYHSGQLHGGNGYSAYSTHGHSNNLNSNGWSGGGGGGDMDRYYDEEEDEEA